MLTPEAQLQVLSQLKKFARTLQQIREAVTPNSRSRAEVAAPAQDGIDYASGGGRLKKPNPNMSLSEMLTTDITGMDATVSGLRLSLHLHCRPWLSAEQHSSSKVACRHCEEASAAGGRRGRARCSVVLPRAGICRHCSLKAVHKNPLCKGPSRLQPQNGFWRS